MDQLRKFNRLCQEQREMVKLAKIRDILDWDQACTMPPDGAQYRGELISCLDEMRHAKATSVSYEKLLHESEEEVAGFPEGSWQFVQVKKSRRRFDDEKKLPTKLVSELARLQPVGFGAWEQARKENTFTRFAPVLEKVVGLLQEKADILGYENHPYDALLKNYEWGLTVETLDRLFCPLKDFLKEQMSSQIHPSSDLSAWISQQGSAGHQETLARRLAVQLGIKENNGCLLTSTHPFSTTLGPADFRITTAYHDENFLSSFFAVAHETGHSLYEQGLPARWWGLEIGQAASFGVHESQSLFWEHRIVGSRSFLRSWFPNFQKFYPKGAGSVTFDDFCKSLQCANPGPIRVSADEVTYCLHIVVRYEIEKWLVNREIQVSDIPEMWNQLYKSLLGVIPADDRQGCLQDVHWSYGELGYFPSYALGHLISAQLTEELENSLGSAREKAGDPVYRGQALEWLRTHVHSKGSYYDPMDLVRTVTGRELSCDSYITYLKDKSLNH